MVNFALSLIILYLLIRGKITYDLKYGVPLWLCMIGTLIISQLLQWKMPNLRLPLIIGLSLIIAVIYILHFRKRKKTSLDYWKLGLLIFIIFDNSVINTMRYLYITGKGPEFITAPLTNQYSQIFNLISLTIACTILYKLFKSEKGLIIQE